MINGESICVVYMGWDNIKSYLGVFENKSRARNFLYNHGCVQKEYYYPPRSIIERDIYRPGEIVRTIVATDEFEKWVKENTKDCPFLYSGGGIDWINLDTVEFNAIVRGFME